MSNSRETRSDSAARTLSEAPAFRVRMGRAATTPKHKSFIGRIKAMVREHGSATRLRRGGGRGGSAAARLPVRVSPQRVAVKSRFVNHQKYRGAGAAATALREHGDYLARRGASRDGERGVAFDGEHELTLKELEAFRDRIVPDRHHFRIMVSPEKGADLDLPSFAREYVKEMETDLKTRLQWFGIAHYDTDNPHVHLLVRGKDSVGKDLVISRDYLSHGMRLQAMEVATRRLGPRRAEDIAQSLARDLTAERVTPLDRVIDAQRALHPQGFVSALRSRDGTPAGERERLRTLARLQYLESLGLAREVSAGIWQPQATLLSRLKALSIRGDIVKSLHARMTGKPFGLDPIFVTHDQPLASPVIGRIIDRGRVDEFRVEEYLLIEGHNGRELYVPLAGVGMDPDADTRVGAIVRMESGVEEGGRTGLRLSGLARDLQSSVRIEGVTFLDRELARDPSASMLKPLGRGFEAAFAAALRSRTLQLESWGLADGEAGRSRVKSGFLNQLYERELSIAHARLNPEFGELQRVTAGAVLRGKVARIEALPSGPHVVVAGAGRYALVPANDALREATGRTVSLSLGSPKNAIAFEPQARQLSVQVQILTRHRGIGRPS